MINFTFSTTSYSRPPSHLTTPSMARRQRRCCAPSTAARHGSSSRPRPTPKQHRARLHRPVSLSGEHAFLRAVLPRESVTEEVNQCPVDRLILGAFCTAPPHFSFTANLRYDLPSRRLGELEGRGDGVAIHPQALLSVVRHTDQRWLGPALDY